MTIQFITSQAAQAIFPGVISLVMRDSTILKNHFKFQGVFQASEAIRSIATRALPSGFEDAEKLASCALATSIVYVASSALGYPVDNTFFAVAAMQALQRTNFFQNKVPGIIQRATYPAALTLANKNPAFMKDFGGSEVLRKLTENVSYYGNSILPETGRFFTSFALSAPILHIASKVTGFELTPLPYIMGALQAVYIDAMIELQKEAAQEKA